MSAGRDAAVEIELGAAEEGAVVGSEERDAPVALMQTDNVLVFFVLYECDQNDDEVCVVQASDPVAERGCSAALKLGTTNGIHGTVTLNCRDGIDADDLAFGLTPENQAVFKSVLPGLEDRIQINYTDTNGEEVTGADLEFKIQNLDVDALNDIVGTFLADDMLPACTP